MFRRMGRLARTVRGVSVGRNRFGWDLLCSLHLRVVRNEVPPTVTEPNVSTWLITKLLVVHDLVPAGSISCPQNIVLCDTSSWSSNWTVVPGFLIGTCAHSSPSSQTQAQRVKPSVISLRYQ
jgi:hypothetical protein